MIPYILHTIYMMGGGGRKREKMILILKTAFFNVVFTLFVCKITTFLCDKYVRKEE